LRAKSHVRAHVVVLLWGELPCRVDFFCADTSVSPIQSLLFFKSCLRTMCIIAKVITFSWRSLVYTLLRLTSRDDFDAGNTLMKHFDSTDMDFTCGPERYEKARTALCRPKSLITPLPSHLSEQRSHEGPKTKLLLRLVLNSRQL
jgi:hypothetical protein